MPAAAPVPGAALAPGAAAAPPSQTAAPSSQTGSAQDGQPSVLQLALLNSLFQGKVTLAAGEDYEVFKERVIAAWSNRPVVDNLGSFIQDHGPPGSQIPKETQNASKPSEMF